MTAMHTYPLAILHIRWLLDAVESWLETLPDGVSINPLQLRTSDRIRLATQDEVAIVITALLDLGILVADQPLRFSHQTLIETSGYRRGVREMLESLPQQVSPPQLCATLPTGLDPVLESFLHKEVLDLRASLFDLLASARTRIVLASPFWDKTTSIELSALFSRRLAAGVLIDILGRVDASIDNQYLALIKQFTPRPGICFYNWYDQSSGDRVGTQTFHFKVAVIDNGDKAYLGSANMTSGGLRSRMELGVMLQGNAAISLAHILDVVLQIAIPIKQ